MPERKTKAPDIPPAQTFDPALIKQDYFHGLLPREDVAVLLTRHGDFLIRLSEADTMGARLETVLSVLHDPKSRCRGQNPEDRMDFSVKKKYYVVCYRSFNTMIDLINFYLKHTMIFKSQQVNLTRAIGLASWEYRAENVQLDDLIAKFSCGEVRKGKVFKRDSPPLEAAIKTISGRSLEAREKVRELMAECRLFQELYHPCVVQYYGVCLIAQPNCFMFEYVSHGPLDQFLRANNQTLKRDELLLMTMSAGWGIEYLHQNSIVHRDIAAKNCLYDRQFVKLCGFARARKTLSYTMKTARKMAVRWMAPETIESFLYTQKSDVYCYGLLIYEIFAAKEPYEGLSNFDAKPFILEGDLNEFPGRTPKKLAEVIKEKMWQTDPEKRANMHQIMLWLQAYTGMELQIVSNANCITATVHQKMDALIAKDVDLIATPNFVEPSPKNPIKRKKEEKRKKKLQEQ